MATLKVNVPIPAPAGSAAFIQTLKVSLAAAAYGVPTQFTRGLYNSTLVVSCMTHDFMLHSSESDYH